MPSKATFSLGSIFVFHKHGGKIRKRMPSFIPVIKYLIESVGVFYFCMAATDSLLIRPPTRLDKADVAYLLLERVNNNVGALMSFLGSSR